MPHCLHCVLGLEFSVWGLSDKLSVVPRPKKKNLTFISPQNVAPFLFRTVSVFFGNTFMTSSVHYFFNNGTLRGLLADRLASHRHLLIVPVLTGNFRSLITLELIIG